MRRSIQEGGDQAREEVVNPSQPNILPRRLVTCSFELLVSAFFLATCCIQLELGSMDHQRVGF